MDSVVVSKSNGRWCVTRKFYDAAYSYINGGELSNVKKELKRMFPSDSPTIEGDDFVGEVFRVIFESERGVYRMPQHLYLSLPICDLFKISMERVFPMEYVCSKHENHFITKSFYEACIKQDPCLMGSAYDRMKHMEKCKTVVDMIRQDMTRVKTYADAVLTIDTLFGDVIQNDTTAISVTTHPHKGLYFISKRVYDAIKNKIPTYENEFEFLFKLKTICPNHVLGKYFRYKDGLCRRYAVPKDLYLCDISEFDKLVDFFAQKYSVPSTLRTLLEAGQYIKAKELITDVHQQENMNEYVHVDHVDGRQYLYSKDLWNASSSAELVNAYNAMFSSEIKLFVVNEKQDCKSKYKLPDEFRNLMRQHKFEEAVEYIRSFIMNWTIDGYGGSTLTSRCYNKYYCTTEFIETMAHTDIKGLIESYNKMFPDDIIKQDDSKSETKPKSKYDLPAEFKVLMEAYDIKGAVKAVLGSCSHVNIDSDVRIIYTTKKNYYCSANFYTVLFDCSLMADPNERYLDLVNEYNDMFPEDQIKPNKKADIHTKLAELDRAIKELRDMLAN